MVAPDKPDEQSNFMAGRQSAQFEGLAREFSEFKGEVRHGFEKVTSDVNGLQKSVNDLAVSTSEMRPLARIFWALITGMLLSLIASGLSLALNLKR